MMRKVVVIGLALGTAVFGILYLLTNLAAVQAASSENRVLYDGSLGGLPDSQGFVYTALDPYNPPFFTAEATQVFSPTLAATILDSTPDMNEYAGYSISPTIAVNFDRATGFQLDLRLRIASETHDSGNDRAGFSITLLADDVQGIELAFWENRIWAQEGGSPPGLFTPAEGVDFDTTAVFVDYSLQIITDTYTLFADGAPILSGPVRDYTAWQPPLPDLDIYETPNMLALSDNTTSAQGETWLAYAAVTTDLFSTPSDPVLNLSPLSMTVSETVGTAVFTVQLHVSSTQTVTVDVDTVGGTAVAGIDYIPISKTLTFSPTIISQTVAVPILNNNAGELHLRQFQVQLHDPTHAQIGNGTALVTIVDDDMDQFVYLPLIVREP